MFEWLGYTKRLQGVRKELAEVEEEMATLPHGEALPFAPVAKAVGKIANILGRVIDSLPK